MARMVLVHGAFAGAWTWASVVPGLEAAGHVVEAIDLPGAAGDPTPVDEIDLRRYADRVVAQLAEGEEPAVLVGHSMGGMVITQAAALAPRRVIRLVYVCAFLPHAGQSLIALTQLPEGADDQVQANLVVEGEPPVATLRQGSERDALFGCCADDAGRRGRWRASARSRWRRSWGRSRTPTARSLGWSAPTCCARVIGPSRRRSSGA